MASMWSGITTPEQFHHMNAWESDMLLDALGEILESEHKIRINLAKIAGGAKVL